MGIHDYQVNVGLPRSGEKIRTAEFLRKIGKKRRQRKEKEAEERKGGRCWGEGRGRNGERE